MTYKTPKFNKKGDIPIFEMMGKTRVAGDNYGDIECPFCDRVVLHEQQEFKIGQHCGNCGAKISNAK